MTSPEEIEALRRNVLGSFDSDSRLLELGQMGSHLPELQQLPREFTAEDKGAVFLSGMLSEYFKTSPDERVFSFALSKANEFVALQNPRNFPAWGLVHSSLVQIGEERGWIDADSIWNAWTPDQQREFAGMIEKDLPQQRGGCYVATAVYGSYDCPEVWVLRRFRDQFLSTNWAGKLLVGVYYAVSPWVVTHGGAALRAFAAPSLDFLVSALRSRGVLDTPYIDPQHKSTPNKL